MKNSKGFTFIELIISISIIAILSILWFIAYSSYLSHSRDSIRKSELSDIYSLINAYWLKAPLPIPDNKIDIYSSWIIIWYQWYAWNNIIKKIEYTGLGKDPLDNTYYTYYLSKDLRNAWMLWFAENPITWSFWLVNKVYATDYSDRYPILIWKKLWIILDENDVPIQEKQELQSSWKLELSSITLNYSALFDNKIRISNNWYSMDVLYWTALTWIIWNTCKQYIEEYNWELLRSWYYLINSSTWITEYNCDMINEIWTWVDKRIATCSWTLITNSYPTNWNTFIQSFDWTNWTPDSISWSYAWAQCWFSCIDNYSWDSPTNSCIQIIDWLCWFSNWLFYETAPTSWLCAAWVVTNTAWTWPWTRSCQWQWWWATVNCSTSPVNYCTAWWVLVWCEVPID